MKRYRCYESGYTRPFQSGTTQSNRKSDTGECEVIFAWPLSANDFYSVRRAALRGVGVARLPALLARDDLSSGALVRLLPLLSSQSGVVHAVFPSRRGIVPAVRLLLDTLSEGFAANPWFVGDCSNDRV